MLQEPISDEERAERDAERAAAAAERAAANRPLAGRLSERSICQTAGYLIRRSLSTAYQTINIPCSVTATGNGEVTIESGYRTPEAMGRRLLRYTAHGSVTDDRLRINTIAVHGVDDEPIDFAQFGF